MKNITSLFLAKLYRKSIVRGALAVVLSASLLMGHQVTALTTATVTATVTATNLDISVSDGSIAFGSSALNTATSTVSTGQSQTVTNNGSDSVFNVKSSNATGGTTWTLGTTTASDVFKLEFSTTTGSFFGTLQATDTYATASSSFGSLQSSPLDFRFTTPTASTDFVQKSLTITVQAAAS